MQDQKKGQSTGSTGSKTGGSAGTKGRAEEQMQNRSDLPNTPTGDWTGAPREAVTHQPGQERSEQAGMSQTSAMLREEQGHAGMQKQTGMQGQAGMEQRGSMGQTERGGTYGEQMRGWETGTERTTTRVTHGRGEQESEDAGMQQASMMLREAREEGDPEMRQREEDLHARQQNLGAREKSLGGARRTAPDPREGPAQAPVQVHGQGARGDRLHELPDPEHAVSDDGGREQEKPGDARFGHGQAEHKPDREHDARQLEPADGRSDRS